MALTFTDRLNGQHFPFGGRQFRAYEVTHDGSTTTVNATDIDMTHIDCAIAGPGTQVLSATSTAYQDLTQVTGSYITMTALSAGATSVIWAIGY